jgi:hypothetical protein
MDWNVAEALRYQPKTLSILVSKYLQQRRIDQTKVWQSALGVKKLLDWSSVMYNSAKEGQSDSLAACMGQTHCVRLLLLITGSALPSISLAISVQFENAKRHDKVYKQGNFNPPGSTAILVEDSYDLLVSNVGAGYLVKDAVA